MKNSPALAKERLGVKKLKMLNEIDRDSSISLNLVRQIARVTSTAETHVRLKKSTHGEYQIYLKTLG